MMMMGLWVHCYSTGYTWISFLSYISSKEEEEKKSASTATFYSCPVPKKFSFFFSSSRDWDLCCVHFNVSDREKLVNGLSSSRILKKKITCIVYEKRFSLLFYICIHFFTYYNTAHRCLFRYIFLSTTSRDRKIQVSPYTAAEAAETCVFCCCGPFQMKYISVSKGLVRWGNAKNVVI